MSGDAGLLPLPDGYLAREFVHDTPVYDAGQLHAYASANLAALQAEVTDLRRWLSDARAEVEGLTGELAEARTERDHEQAMRAANKARAERLAEALRDALECGDDGDWQSARNAINAALQEAGNE